MKLSYDNWFCCSLDHNDSVELCKIRRDKRTGLYQVITYYDGKEQHSGTRSSCEKWINEHWIEKRYLEHYGKV